MSSSGAVSVTVLRPVPFRKCASRNYNATQTPHTASHLPLRGVRCRAVPTCWRRTDGLPRCRPGRHLSPDVVEGQADDNGNGTRAFTRARMSSARAETGARCMHRLIEQRPALEPLWRLSHYLTCDLLPKSLTVTHHHSFSLNYMQNHSLSLTLIRNNLSSVVTH